MTGDGRIKVAGAKPVQPDYQDAYARAWAEDAKAAEARALRERGRGGHGSTSNDAVNETQRIRTAGLTLHRRAKKCCSACGKMRLPDQLVSPVARGHYGSRVCADNETCWEKARKWARSSD